MNALMLIDTATSRSVPTNLSGSPTCAPVHAARYPCVDQPQVALKQPAIASQKTTPRCSQHLSQDLRTTRTRVLMPRKHQYEPLTIVENT